MLWKLLKKLFGLDFIRWTNTCESGVAVVGKNLNGEGVFYESLLLRIERVFGDDFTKDWKIEWLTCEPCKYLSDVQARAIGDRP